MTHTTTLPWLLCDLFTEHDLRLFVEQGPMGDQIRLSLPDHANSKLEFSATVVRLWMQHGLCDKALFLRLVESRPNRFDAIVSAWRSPPPLSSGDADAHERRGIAPPRIQTRVQPNEWPHRLAVLGLLFLSCATLMLWIGANGTNKDDISMFSDEQVIECANSMERLRDSAERDPLDALRRYANTHEIACGTLIDAIGHSRGLR